MKTERLDLSLDHETLERIDLWRSRQPDDPSRAEAIQRLVDIGLAEPRREGARISNGEKLILRLLRDLWRYQRVEVQEGIDLEFVCEAMSRGHEWALEWKYPDVFEISTISQQTVSEVCAVLQMWSLIEQAYVRLSEDEKRQVEVESKPFGCDVRFSGFSVNDEINHYNVADFLINKMDRFRRFKGRELNSHYPCIDSYRRMLMVFKSMFSTKLGCEFSTKLGCELSVSEIIDLLKERVHPEWQEK